MMKIRSLMYVLMGTFTIVACTNSDNEATTGDSPTDKISTGFDWATSRTVSVSITSANKTLVSLYSDAECKIPLLENALVEGETTVDLNIPMHSQAVYAKYTAMSGSQVRTINLKAVTRADGSINLEDAVAPTSEEDADFRFYHNTGVAMFEDNWPKQSNGPDNDLNDVVIEYDLKVTECQVENLLPAHGYKEGLLLTLDLRAKGGYYPTKLGVELIGLDKKYINEITSRILWKGGQGTEEEMVREETGGDFVEVNMNTYKLTVDAKTGNPVIMLDGLSALGDKQNFFQTTEGYIVIGKPMLRADIKFAGKNRSEITDNEGKNQLEAYRNLILDTKKQNFFIVTNDNKEIHMKGYEPTRFYTNYDVDAAKADVEMINGIPYCNKNGFVWGVKVPVGVKHTYERVPFAEAYPQFTEWVQSNGAQNKDWYLAPLYGKVVEAW